MPKYIDLDEALERINASPAFPNVGVDGYFLLGTVDDLLKSQPIADVVPRSEVEKLKKKYEEEIEDLESTQEIAPEAKYLIDAKADKMISLLTEINKTQDQIKQDVAREVIDEFKSLVINYVKDRDLLLVAFKNAVAHAENELKKKYIGE